jgi:hypothetical protein
VSVWHSQDYLKFWHLLIAVSIFSVTEINDAVTTVSEYHLEYLMGAKLFLIIMTLKSEGLVRWRKQMSQL